MTDSGEQMEDGVSNIEWGPAIPVNGKRPEWLSSACWTKDRLYDPAGSGPFVEVVRAGEIGANEWSHMVSLRLPADHQRYAQPTDDYTRGRTDGIRDALAALPEPKGMVSLNYREEASKAITALLPKDEAAELVKAFENDPRYAQDFHASLPDFARWLIQQGKIKGV